MEKSEIMSKCRYYRGESQCPSSFIDTPKELFWYEERAFVTTGQNIEEWERRGVDVKANLTGEKLRNANRYTPQEFGIIVFIEEHYSRFDPYDDMKWIYEY